MVKKNEELDFLFDAILSLKTQEECYLFFEDICTIKELQAMSQRMSVAKQLSENQNYNQVYASTGVSSATICRVNKCLQYGSGGYRIALERIAKARSDKNAGNS